MMKSQTLPFLVTKYALQYKVAEKATDRSIADSCPPTMLRDLRQARESELEALKLLLFADILARLEEDRDVTTTWMLNCLEAGKIVEMARSPCEM
jgi:hypothetical protein